MAEKFASGEILAATAYSQRWSVLAKTGTDLPTLQTWDPRLRRERRVLVPVDVQAFVATEGGEQVTAVGGVLGDPEPFADLTALAAGVHLHWALPDSLLAGRAAEGTDRPDFPRLPDRWVVVRTLSRPGQSTVGHRGWVIDATTGGVAALASYAGGPIPGTGTDDVLDPLDATSRRSLLWAGTYAGAQGRFTLHDDLADVATSRAAGNTLASRACYLVAGWFSDDADDPLRGVGLLRTLEEVTAGLGWIVTRDGPDSDEEDVDPATKRAESRIGKKAPTEGGVTTVTSTGKKDLRHESLAPSGMVQVDRVSSTILGRSAPSYRTLLHGAVLGVPVDGTATGLDRRPSTTAVSGAMGLDLDDVAAALASRALASSTSSRRAAERLMAAFTSGLMPRLGSPDGLFDLDEHEHTDTFTSVPGPPLPGAKPDRLRADDSLATNPLTMGRKGRGARRPMKSPKVSFTGGVKGLRGQQQRSQEQPPPKGSVGGRSPAQTPASREVIRAAPRIFRPAAPLIGLRGARPSSRHHHDRSHDASARLVCRRPGDIVTALTGIVEGQRVLPTLGSGAVPTEVLPLAREMVLLNGYDASWLASVGAQRVGTDAAVRVRLGGELLRLYGTEATYDGTGISALAQTVLTRGGPRATVTAWDRHRAGNDAIRAQLASALSAHSLLEGMAPSPVALTTWAQPWCPLFIEWEVRLEGRDDLEGWQLGTVDLERIASTPAPTPTVTRILRGRAPLNTGVGTTLVASIRSWLAEEQMRDEQPGGSQLSDADEEVLSDLAEVLAPLDVVSASLDGIREQLLGIAYSGFVVRQKSDADDDGLPTAVEAATPLFGGTLTISALRLVDTFGRALPVDVSDLPTTSTLEVAGTPSTVRVAPRLQHGARWLFRLVDPTHPVTADPLTATEAWVDQVRPELSVNPVSGFLLPDHIDEACEVFDRDGHPLGQIDHDPVTGAVIWEPAPGRPVPPSAGPLDSSTPLHAQLAGRIAAGLVQADIEVRTSTGAGSGAAPEHTALSAFLGVIDSTLWSVDTYAALGSPTIAGLVGRPLAIVRATLRLDAPDDLGEVRVTATGGPAERVAAFEALRRHRFPVRLGDLGRSDDATIGFFVDDDYSRFHIVDKVVAQVARESRRHRGHLGLLGATVTPDLSPIEHPYIHAEDTLYVSVGQVVRLTIVMVPGGQVHLTSGITPRKALSLADEWVTPGLRRMSPSMRVGPLLVDPAEIKLPLVASLGPDQVFTRRTGPLTWRDDPIVAATAAAYLPRLPHEAQEGWIRVTPDPTEGG